MGLIKMSVEIKLASKMTVKIQFYTIWNFIKCVQERYAEQEQVNASLPHLCYYKLQYSVQEGFHKLRPYSTISAKIVFGH